MKTIELSPKKQKQVDVISDLLRNAGIRFTVSAIKTDEVIIEPHTQTTGNLPAGSFDGMQLIGFDNGDFEISEYMAGARQDRLYIYKVTRKPAIAIKNLLKYGNKQKPIKIY